MASQEEPSEQKKPAARSFLPELTLGKWQRRLSGLIGLGLLSFGVFSGVWDDPNTLAALALVLGSFFLYLAFSGRPGRMSIKGAGAELSYEPHVPLPAPDVARAGETSPPPETSEPSPAARDIEVVDKGSASETVEVEKREPFIEALDAWFDKDYAGFDAKMKEAVSAAEDEDSRVSREALRLGWLYNAGQSAKLQELEELGRQHPNSHYPLIRLAESFETANDFDQAARLYDEGLKIETLSEERRLILLSQLGRALTKAERFGEAEERLKKGLDEAPSEEGRRDIHKFLSDLYDEWGKKDQMQWHLEKRLESNPGDTETRFRLAYSYSETGWQLAGLYHYNIINSQRGGSGELNNLAVDLDRLDMPITAMKYYRLAANDGYGLAAANFARSAARHGFLELAREVLSEPLKQKEIDDSVHSAAAAIAEREKEEGHRFERIIDAGDTERLFVVRRTEVEMATEAPMKSAEAEGIWEATPGDITLERQGEKLGGRFKG